MINEKTVYEDYKYSMQDVGNLYLGAKYTFSEILKDETIYFKYRMLVNQHILKEADPEDSLETHFYYLSPDSFLVSMYKQTKTKIKVSILETRKGLFQKTGKRVYTTKVFPVEKLVAIPVTEKEKLGMVIQEISMSKFALMTI